MKALLFLFNLFCFSAGFAQTAKTDLTKASTSPERQAILETLRLKLQPDLKSKPKLVVTKLMMRAGFAFFSGQVKDTGGKDIDFRKTAYKDAVKEGMFDGDGTTALLKKSGSKWKVLAYAVGPTDVPWGCWWKEFKAPKDIFDYAEICE